MSSTRCCNDCPIPLEGEPVDEVHIRTEDIPEFMRDNLAAHLRVDPDRVNVKATTEEGLGFTGAGEGMAAHAVCLLERMEQAGHMGRP